MASLSQTIMAMVVLNIVMVTVGFINNGYTISDTIHDMQFGEDGDGGIYGMVKNLDTFVDQTRSEDKWGGKYLKDVALAFQNGINLVFVGLKIVAVVLGSIVGFPIDIFREEAGIAILNFIGFAAWLFINIFNIMGILKVYAYLKGSVS